MTGNLRIVAKLGFTTCAALLLGNPSAIAGPPGVVIDCSPDPQTQYVGSPSLAVLPHGDYVASHDWFGPGTKYNRISLMRSTDRGQAHNQHDANYLTFHRIEDSRQRAMVDTPR